MDASLVRVFGNVSWFGNVSLSPRGAGGSGSVNPYYPHSLDKQQEMDGCHTDSRTGDFDLKIRTRTNFQMS